MKNWSVAFLLIMVNIACSSCFEILEEIQMNDNGSGQFSLTINMSESKVKLNSVMMLDSIQGHKVPKKTDISQQMAFIKQRISKIPGISNTQTHFDFNEFIGSIKFSFTNVQQINNAMKIIMEEYKIKDYSIPAYQYNPALRTLTRTFGTQPQTLVQYNKLKKEDKEIFQKAKFTSIFKFDKEIKLSVNTFAKLSKNKKAVMQQASLHSIINNTTKINHSITLEK